MKKKIKIIILVVLLGLSIGTVSLIQYYIRMNEWRTYKPDKDAIFHILYFDEDGTKDGGTGFFINAKGVAVTAYHIIERAVDSLDEVSIILNNQQKLDVAEILYVDTESDIAIFCVKNPNKQKFPWLKVNTTFSVDIDDQINIYSYKVDDSELEIKNKYQVKNIRVDSGDSGSPVFNSVDRVIGIAYAVILQSDGLRFKEGYCWITPIAPAIDEIKKYQK